MEQIMDVSDFFSVTDYKIVVLDDEHANSISSDSGFKSIKIEEV